MERLKEDETYRDGLHVARTLFQSYYDENSNKKTNKSTKKSTEESTDEIMKSKDKWKDGQVVTRYVWNEFYRESEGKADKEPIEIPTLVVKQLWLWTINKSTSLEFLH